MEIFRIFAEMPAKKSRTNAIDDSEILAIYEAVLPLLNHERSSYNKASSQIKRRVRTFIPFDFIHHVCQFEPAPEDPPLMIRLDKPGHENPKPEMIPRQRFKETLERDFEDCVKELHEKYGERQGFDYYRIVSRGNPNIAIGFFRRVTKTKANRFSMQDKHLFDCLAPHLVLIYRTLMLHAYHSENVQYFGAFTTLATKMAKDHLLSESEVKLVPDILSGYSNEQIAERHFVSLATVKTHVNHILKKTGTKNRADFLTTFFTSSGNVQL